MQTTISEVPPDCGRRLLPTLIDDIARSNPDRPFASLPKTTDPRDGFIDINFRTIATAINRCAWWIETEFGRSLDFESLAYMGPSDLRSAILIIAAIKTGYKVGPDPSLRLLS